jgi:S-disulfanyl-L-cysteine oxidoreductase SoxD
MRSLVPRSSMAAVAAVLMALLAPGQGVGQERDRLNVGRAVVESDLRAWDIDVLPNGAGLPIGRGSVEEGRLIYSQKCLACHGANGSGQPMERLAGGRGTLTSNDPVKTIGSYWPYATTVFDYVRRAMPLDKPQSLTANEVYALTAYLLHLNDIVSADAVMDARRLPRVRMPNRSAFRADSRPDVSNVACMDDCR